MKYLLKFNESQRFKAVPLTISSDDIDSSLMFKIIDRSFVSAECVGDISDDKMKIYDVESYEIGCGTSLMNHVIEWSKNKNLKQIWLYVMNDNERALRLYSKLGFVEERSFDGYQKMILDLG